MFLREALIRAREKTQPRPQSGTPHRLSTPRMPNGTLDGPWDHYTFASPSAYQVGLALSSLLGIKVLVQAPVFTGSGPNINPGRDAGSSVPAGLARGECVSIYGTGLTATHSVRLKSSDDHLGRLTGPAQQCRGADLRRGA